MGLFADLAGFGRTPARGARRAAAHGGGRTLAPGGPEERNRRFAQKITMQNYFSDSIVKGLFLCVTNLDQQVLGILEIVNI